MKRSWSLAGRLTLWAVLAVLIISLSVAALGHAFVSNAVEGELEALAVEELHELRAVWRSRDEDSPGTPQEAFGAIVGGFGTLHPTTPFAWRVRKDGEPWGEFGSTELLSRLPESWAPPDKTRVLDDGVRTRADEIEPGLTVEVAVDGSERALLLERFFTYVLALGGLAALGALVCCAWIGRWMGRMLQRVARAADQVPATAGLAGLDPRDLPRELVPVVEALSDSFARVERESERTRMLAAGLAHELRSPLQNLLGEAEVTLLRERSPGEYQRALESQLEELRDLTRVVDNLVTLCTPSREAPTELEDFDLASEVELRLGKERAAAARRGVELRVRSEGDTRCRGDREALLLALRNLVANAVEWSPAGEAVDLTVEGRDGELSLTVDDAGPGVPAAERERIFTPFHSGPARPGRRAGYGLGLALTRSAAQAHGGRIEVGDSPRGGARFRLVLPRAPHQGVGAALHPPIGEVA
jgi:signal transduction histidine kinase